jgi:hypothetical protein
VDALFAAAGTGTSVGLNIGSGKNLKLVGDVIDTNGNELLKVTATTSAVNEVTLANAATGGAPTLTASGGDTNIGMKLVGKGTGEVTARVNGSDVFNASSNFGFKNRIINGAMVIDQRNAGASVTPTADTYTLDRWSASISTASKFSVQQSTTAPTGFINSLKITSASAYTVGASDFFQIIQIIEGYNIADLGWGTANAQPVTLSFKVYSSLTGTFGGSITNFSANRSYPFTYSISTANTWTSISVTIAGDTSGTWSTNNSGGIVVRIGLGVGTTYSGTANAWAGATYFSATGATSVVGTNGATFYITGVQLEKGSTATSFDYRPFGTELDLCQRYFEQVGDVVGGSTAQSLFLDVYSSGSGNTAPFNWFYRQQKRAAPTIALYGTLSTSNVSGSVGVLGVTAITACIYANAASAGRVYWYNNVASGYSASAEL